jgi:hypothetical protein
MKKLSLAVIFLVSIGFLASSCYKEVIKGNGIEWSETRSVSGFTRIKLDGSGAVSVVKGAAFKVTVTDDQNILPYVKTILSGNELIIGYKNDAWVRKGSLKVAIEMPFVEGLQVDGSGSMDISGGFNTTSLLKATVNGSGNVFIRDGNADSYEIVINGSGDIRSFGLASKIALVRISGSGDAEVKVTDKLDVVITGSGNVYYMGNPAVFTKITGSGKVNKR